MSFDDPALRLFSAKILRDLRDATLRAAKYGKRAGIEANEGAPVMITQLLSFAAGIAKACGIDRAAFGEIAAAVFDADTSDDIRKLLQ